ncbi:peptidase C39 [Enterococcus villorum]|uniref:Peptidase C39 n=1 Tax=Enterococcus villorum TaxID=112904 RepID=A0A1V8YUP5_9ENTE|nr:C39 family peptidase [Enterococcus villorum]OQO71315.1 peptidase C39 [Enterococcus villorum]OQO76362.1 peptidase C39 [Enterococcus villorum]
MKKSVGKKILFLGVLVFIVFSSLTYLFGRNDKESTTTTSGEKVSSTDKKQVLLDVPLENQLEEPALENGCEVTSLSMLFSYYGYQTSKNQLAKQLNYVPVFNADGTHGDPNEGFVGDITGGDWAMGVYVPPIASLAQQIVKTDYHTESKTDATLKDIKKALQKGHPIWTSVTLDFQVPSENDFLTWQTNNGKVRVTPLVHACVVTGYDKDTIYVNDPYGKKDRAVPIKDFEAIFTAMGGQMLTLEKS